jgi:hypothetical protein
VTWGDCFGNHGFQTLLPLEVPEEVLVVPVGPQVGCEAQGLERLVQTLYRRLINKHP